MPSVSVCRPSFNRQIVFRLPVVLIIAAIIALGLYSDVIAPHPYFSFLVYISFDPAIVVGGIALGFVPGRYLRFVVITVAAALILGFVLSFWIAEFWRDSDPGRNLPLTSTILRAVVAVWIAHIVSMVVNFFRPPAT